jgi:serine/threonine protein kinase
MQGFNHPNIVKLNTTFIHDNFIVFEQEFVSNGSLHALIDKYKLIKGVYGLGKELTKIYMA